MKSYFFIIAFLGLIVSLQVSAQDGMSGGVSTGQARVYTSKRTTGIVDPNAKLVFRDVTEKSGLETFKCVSGSAAKEYILETTACSVALLDFDNDGKLDIYLLSGSTIDALHGKTKPAKSALFRNLGDWKFVDVTDKAGVANERWGMGVSVGDYNNDGFPDMFVSNYGVARLYKNNGDGTFTDVAPKVGLDIEGWFTGSSFGDFDQDGRLDLFVPAYLEFDIENLPPSPLAAGKDGKLGRNFCQFRGEPVMCGPRGLKGASDRLFRQRADGTFEDVGEKLGVTDEGDYYGFSSVFVDVDDDRDLDLLVVNDSTPKQLYLNVGGKFEEIGYPSGIALNDNGREQAGMGVAVGDFDNDGLVDFQVTNFSDDSNTLYRNDGEGNFTDITFQAGLGEASIPFLGWGTSFLDFNNDGWKDLIVANGHVYPVVDNFEWGTSFKQQILLFENEGRDEKNRVNFKRAGAAKDSALAESYLARGLALGDFDGDGRMDVVINNMDSGPTLLKNVVKDSGNWLQIKLRGGKGSPSDGIGSVVFAKTGDITQRGDLISGGGYASQNQQIISFGLGKFEKVDELRIVWPTGQVESLKTSAVNTTITIEQGKGEVKD